MAARGGDGALGHSTERRREEHTGRGGERRRGRPRAGPEEPLTRPGGAASPAGGRALTSPPITARGHRPPLAARQGGAGPRLTPRPGRAEPGRAAAPQAALRLWGWGEAGSSERCPSEAVLLPTGKFPRGQLVGGFARAREC